MVVNVLLMLATVQPFTVYCKLVTTVEPLVSFYICFSVNKRKTMQSKNNSTAINGQWRQTNSTDHIWPTPEALFRRCFGFLLVFINI